MMNDSLDVRLRIPMRRIWDLLACALEGGSGYWCRIISYIEPKSIAHYHNDGRTYRHLDYPLSVGGAVILIARENYPLMGPHNPDDELKLDLPAIRKGVGIMAEKYGRHFGDFLGERDDAVTGDVFLQCCLLGEIVYG